jgi:hypothetical protein
MVVWGECFPKKLPLHTLSRPTTLALSLETEERFSVPLLLEIESIISAPSVPAAPVSRCSHDYMISRASAQLSVSAAQ